MSAGFSLIGLMLGLSLGSAALVLAMDRYQSMALAWAQVRQHTDRDGEARYALFELARDLRMHGQAGCQTWSTPFEPLAYEVVVDYAQSGWQVVSVEKDASGALTALQVQTGQMGAGNMAQIFVSSCGQLDVLDRDQDYRVEPQGGVLKIDLLPGRALKVGGRDGHHLPSLEVGPRVLRRYRLERDPQGRGTLTRQENQDQAQRLVQQVQDFSLQTDAAEMRHIELKLEKDALPWRLSVASRQGGVALVGVMVLLLVCSLQLAGLQRLHVDEIRKVSHGRDWWQTLQFAESALKQAERVVVKLNAQPGHAAWFSALCVNESAPSEWRKGLCSRSGPGGVSIAPWQRAQTWYSPGVTYWENDEQFARCVANYFPHREKRKHGPAFRRPCFIVELLDAHYQAEDSGLYRITVLAWGREPHTRVMLQSYWLVGKSARRLAWKEVF